MAEMRITSDSNPTEWHCQHCNEAYNCDDHVFNKTDCSKCEFRHRIFVDLEDLRSIGLTAAQREAIGKLQKFYTY